MWELRLGYTQGQNRLYFGEPPSHPDLLVAVRCHEKWLRGTAQEITDAQNREMDLASQRLADGDPDWGREDLTNLAP